MWELLIEKTIFYFHQGGFVMGPLVLGTFILWYGLGYRFAVLRRGNRRSVRVLVERYRNGYARDPAGVVDGAVVRGLSLVQRQPGWTRGMLDDAFAEVRQETGRYAVLVRAIVIAAPLAGLLGTVTGMIEMFDSLGTSTFNAQSGGIAGGIAEALISTQMGLVVAVPGMVVGRILDRRQEMLGRELDQIQDILCAEKV